MTRTKWSCRRMDRRTRTFVNWTTLEVLDWLKGLSLSRDYSRAFEGGRGRDKGFCARVIRLEYGEGGPPTVHCCTSPSVWRVPFSLLPSTLPFTLLRPFQDSQVDQPRVHMSCFNCSQPSLIFPPFSFMHRWFDPC